ncbi:MAG: alpha-galactosidase [Erysipelotrichaceae bacterium]
MIQKRGDYFVIHTQETTMVLQIRSSRHLGMLYYGPSIGDAMVEALGETMHLGLGNAVVARQDPTLSLEYETFALSTMGKGDVREPMVMLTHADGRYVNEFLYVGYEIMEEAITLDGLPCVKANGKASQTLIIHTKDEEQDVLLTLYFTVFEDCDVITRFHKLSAGSQPVVIDRLFSSQLDLDLGDVIVGSLSGKWADEANLSEQALYNQIVIDSKCGVSSSRHNPFFYVKSKDTTYHHGLVYGSNLIYSGNHKAIIERSSFGKTRILQGIHPDGFAWHLQPGESFTTPQALSCVSKEGLLGMSKMMHAAIHAHIVPTQFANQPRPILLNSWEATYFDFKEASLLKLARKARDVGIELFVLDDGWFSNRNDDTSSLGDWDVNLKKLPQGLAGLANKIEELGMQFGLWVEPEMISVNSELYRNHPEWAVAKGDTFNQGRNQLVLDLSNPDVVSYLKTTFHQLFASAKISYVKWDMNRIMSDHYASTLQHQSEFTHRYQLGLYELFRYLTQAFPNILFENCCSGGNRFDLGMLAFSPQIWASDNTDAWERCRIQANLLLGYPQSCMGAHVSGSVNHQTLRQIKLASRFAIAAMGILGYELNLCECSKGELEEIKEQIAWYKTHRELLQFGQMEAIHEDGLVSFQVVSSDKKAGIAMHMQGLCRPHNPSLHRTMRGLDAHLVYEASNRVVPQSVLEFGDLINQIAPIRVKQDSLLHHTIAKVYKMQSESHQFNATGLQLLHAGYYLPQAFCGVGFNEQTRVFSDFASRMYVFKAKQ